MDVVITRGAGMAPISGPECEQIKDRASFRLTTVYSPQHDQLFTRFDVRDVREQHNGVIWAWPTAQHAGSRISRSDPLIVPSSGISSGIAIEGDRKTLAAMLRGLADALDAD